MNVNTTLGRPTLLQTKKTNYFGAGIFHSQTENNPMFLKKEKDARRMNIQTHSWPLIKSCQRGRSLCVGWVEIVKVFGKKRGKVQSQSKGVSKNGFKVTKKKKKQSLVFSEVLTVFLDWLHSKTGTYGTMTTTCNSCANSLNQFC